MVGWSVRRWLVPVLAVSLVVGAAGAVGRGALALVVWQQWQPGRTVAAPMPAGGVDVARRDREVVALLDRRARALLAGDTAAVLADVDPGSADFVAEQRAMVSGLRRVPLGDLSYEVLPDRALDRPAARERLGPTAYVAAVVVRHRLEGYDEGSVARPAGLTFVLREDRWLLAADDDALQVLPEGGHADPWDVGEVAVHEGRRGLVLADPRRDEDLDEVGPLVDAALAEVEEFWPPAPGSPTGWSGRMVVLLPGDRQTFLRHLGDEDGDDSDDVAAVMVPAYPEVPWFESPGSDSEMTGARVVVAPDVGLEEWGPEELRTLLTHEAVHVATAGVDGPWAPTWLAEGLADYVSFRAEGGVGADQLETYDVDEDTAERLEAGGYRLELPGTVGFYEDPERVDANYVAGWLACAFVADRWGEDRLRALYRAAADAQTPGEASDAQDAALRSVLGMERAAFEQAASTWVRTHWVAHADR